MGSGYGIWKMRHAFWKSIGTLAVEGDVGSGCGIWKMRNAFWNPWRTLYWREMWVEVVAFGNCVTLFGILGVH